MDNPRLPFLADKARRLPLLPGVYIMKDKSGQTIYIGKAKALKNRVSSYFRSVEKHLPKVYQMVSLVYDFDYILTESEFEALVLECSLIKQSAPKYNILLKDDKGYSYIKLEPGDFGRIRQVFDKDMEPGARYIGPYLSSFVVNQTVDEVSRAFLLPTCTKKFPQEFGKGRPCLNYHIKRCMGVCRGKISAQEYQEILSQAVDYIHDGGVQSVERLTKQMERYAEQMEFEKAARLRDRIRAISRVGESQKVVFTKTADQDVVALERGDNETCALVLRFRNQRLVDKQDFLLGAVDNLEEARQEFLLRYYSGHDDIPVQVTLDGEIPEMDLTQQMITKLAGRRVRIHIPQRGQQERIVEMARENAAERLGQVSRRSGREVAALDELARLLGLKQPPDYIEAYDISNIGEETVVGGMIVFAQGKPLKRCYRKFSIKTVEGTDDYACMCEVLRRRFERYLDQEKQDEAFDRMPDLILLDGGRGHVGVVTPMLRQMGIETPIFGMVKDDRHRTRAIAQSGGEIAISACRRAFTLVGAIQEEVHRYSITFSRAKHQTSAFQLSLCECPGIGKSRAAALFKKFKTAKAIREADVEALCEVLPRPVSQKLYAFLHAPADGDENL